MFDVAVIGGGLVGKTAALALTRAGLRVALFAQQCPLLSTSTAFDIRVYALSASSQALLEQLQVWKILDLTCLSPVYDMCIYGDNYAQLNFSAFLSSVSQLAWIAESSLIERALDIMLHFQPNLTWIDKRAQRLDITTDIAVIELSNGYILEANLIVGADGAHSWVRAQMGAKVERCDYQQTSVVANFRIERSHCETAYQWFRDGEIIALLPLPGPHVSLVWSACTEHANELLHLDPLQFAAEVKRVTLDRFGELECVSPTKGFSLALQKVDRLIAPRVVLVGDAAHLIHPLAGQGMNLGLRDVAALDNVITKRESFRDLGDIVLLRRYERARCKDIYALMILTDSLQRLFSIRGNIVRTLRNMGMAFIDTQLLLKHQLVIAALWG